MAVVLAASALALTARPAASDELPRAAADDWIELESPHFTFVSQAGTRFTERLALELEELHSVLSRLAGGSPKDPVPTVIYVFDRSRDFRDYVFLRGGEPASASGFFLRREELNLIVIDGSRRAEATGVVFHEFTHEVMSARLPGLPLFFEEGLAEVYETFRIHRDGAEIGRPVDRHLVWLSRRTLMPIEDLVAVDHDSPEYTESDRQGDFYAQSWALVHLLLFGDEGLTATTRDYLRHVQRVGSATEAFRQLYGPDFDQLERRLREYVRRQTFQFVRLPVQPNVVEPFATRDLPPAEVLERLGELLVLEDPPRPGAALHLDAALKLEPAAGRALSGLGLLAEHRARWSDADDLHRRAVAALPTDPVVLLRRARFELSRRSDAKAAALDLQRCTDVSPGYGPCWVRLAEAWLAAGRGGPEAVTVAATGYRLLPDRPDAAAHLFELLLIDGRLDEAAALVTRFADRRPVDARAARSRLVSAHLRRARELVVDDRLDDARAEVARAKELLPLTARQRSLAARIEATAAAIERHRLLERLAEAHQLLEADDADGARDVASEVLEDPHADADVRAGADRLILEIDDPDAVRTTPRTFPTVSQREIDALNALIDSGQLDRAIELLERFDERVSPGDPDWIDAKLAEIRRVRDHNRFAEAYNRAVDLLEAGNPAAAEAELEALLEWLPEGPEAAEARGLLLRIRQRR